MRVLIVGCGYVGLPLGVELQRAGHEVFGLRRSRAAESALRAAGLHPVFADVTDPDSLRRIPDPFDWVINCTAAGGAGLDAYRAVYIDGTRNLLSWLAARPPRRFIYTSSTSVYPQNDGSWVTEESPTEPTAETGRILLAAEQLLLEAHGRSGFPATVLRLAGIYGPERGYWFKQFLKGEATMDKDGTRFLNMIHRDDVAGAIVAALERARSGEIYNVVDNLPVAQKDLFRWLSEALEMPMPPSALPAGVPRKRGSSSKRVSNRKLREELGYELKFPTFREGFKTVTGPTQPTR